MCKLMYHIGVMQRFFGSLSHKQEFVMIFTLLSFSIFSYFHISINVVTKGFCFYVGKSPHILQIKKSYIPCRM